MQYYTPRKLRSILTANIENSPSPVSPIQKKREAIFTKELQALVERVKNPANASKLPLDSSFFQKLYHKLVPIEKKQEQQLLEAIYIPEDSIQDQAIIAYTSYILERIGIHTFSWHFLAYDSNAYFSEIAQGLDITTKKNFLFLKSDPYIQRTQYQFFELEITNELKSDPFFVKKFSQEFLGLYSGAYFFFLDQPGVDACLVAFRERETGMKKEKESEQHILQNWLPRITEKLQSLSPAILRYRKEKLQPKFFMDDMLTAYMYYFKVFLGQGWKKVYIQHIHLELKVDSERYYLEKQFLSQILSYLGPREKIIHTGIHRYMILTQDSLESKIQEIAKRDGLSIQLQSYIYPEFGENLLLYL